MCRLSWKSGSLILLLPSGPVLACTGIGLYLKFTMVTELWENVVQIQRASASTHVKTRIIVHPARGIGRYQEGVVEDSSVLGYDVRGWRRRKGSWCLRLQVSISPRMSFRHARNNSPSDTSFPGKEVSSGAASLVMCNSFLKFKRPQFHGQCSYNISRWLWPQHNVPKILHQVTKHPVCILDKNRMTYMLTPTVFRCKLPGH
jgi:hypothetical protein